MEVSVGGVHIWAFSKGPRIPGFGKIILLRIQGFRFGNFEGSARYLH